MGFRYKGYVRGTGESSFVSGASLFYYVNYYCVGNMLKLELTWACISIKYAHVVESTYNCWEFLLHNSQQLNSRSTKELLGVSGSQFTAT